MSASTRCKPRRTTSQPGQPAAGLVGLFDSFRARTPQLYVDVDRAKVKTMGVALTDVFEALQAYLGSFYVNDFNRFGRHVAGQCPGRRPLPRRRGDRPAIKVRNAMADMVPLGSVADVRDSARAGPDHPLQTCFPAARDHRRLPPGVSTGDVLATMERLAEKLPRNMTSEWTELSYMQKVSHQREGIPRLAAESFQRGSCSGGAGLLRAGGPVRALVAAVAVILVRTHVSAERAGRNRAGGHGCQYFRAGRFVVLVGLACKNAILIVEFARDRQEEGASRFDAAMEAARVRLRPIVMTSFAFILGVLPLVIAQGAGAEMRRTLGTAVFAGSARVTFFGIFLTPVFYYVVRRFFGGGSS